MRCTAYLGLGSNLGDRRAYLQAASEAIKRLPGIYELHVSSVYESAAIELADSEAYPFLNIACRLITDLPPLQLLRSMLAIEQKLGRTRSANTLQKKARPIDIDLLLYADWQIHTKELCLPHPRMQERLFVLQPLSELLPAEWKYPGTDENIQVLLGALPSEQYDQISPGGYTGEKPSS